MQAAGCGQGSSEAQVCRLSVLFSWCEALKVILVCFERQLGSQWYWLSLQVKEMALRKVGGLALWDFLDFIVRTRIPIFVLLRPFIQCKVRYVLLLWEVTSPMDMLFSRFRANDSSNLGGDASQEDLLRSCLMRNQPRQVSLWGYLYSKSLVNILKRCPVPSYPLPRKNKDRSNRTI